MRVSKKKLKEMFPNLAKELSSEKQRVSIGSIRSDVQTGEKAVSENFVHYEPDIVDFIRRCDTEEQAKEIIDFMERRGQVDVKYAARIRKQLEEKGVRSFGSKKRDNYYLTYEGR